MADTLGGLEQRTHLFQLLCGGNVGERDLELSALHVHVHTDLPLVFR